MVQSAHLGFRDAASPLMEELISFHDTALLILALIISLVAYASIFLVLNKCVSLFKMEGQALEIIWTILPGIMLIFLALPSLRLLYLLDETGETSLLIKAMGHQWYWSYEYSDFMDIEFDSYMLPKASLDFGEFRLLEVDSRIVVPEDTNVRVLVASSDVIHSWTVPSMGVKADAIPGRLNQVSFFSNYPGIFYGQCSEICGANHSFMPIVMEVVPMEKFAKWIAAFTN